MENIQDLNEILTFVLQILAIVFIIVFIIFVNQIFKLIKEIKLDLEIQKEKLEHKVTDTIDSFTSYKLINPGLKYMIGAYSFRKLATLVRRLF